jgi:transposase-like protein
MAKQSKQKEKAKALYLTGQYSQKEIAEITGISEKTISAWANAADDKGMKWEDMKTSLLTTRTNELRRLYKMLQVLNNDIDNRAELNIPINSKEADALLKITTAIKNLEIETSIAEKVDVATDFISFVSTEDQKLAEQISDWFEQYLNSIK